MRWAVINYNNIFRCIYTLIIFQIIIEVMLGQGKIIDALRLAKNSLGLDKVPARKFLEAAHKTKDDLIFHSVFRFFQMRNMKLYETLSFPKGKQGIFKLNCATFLTYFFS